MPNLLVFEDKPASERTWVRRLKTQLAEMGVQFQQANSLEVLQTALDTQAADVVFVDATGVRGSRVDLLTMIQAQRPELRALVVVDPATCYSKALQQLLVSPSVDFVRTPIDVQEVWQRIRRLTGSPAEPRGAADRGATTARTQRPERRGNQPSRRVTLRHTPEAARLVRHLVPDLRNANGRLDAKKIAALLGLPLSDVARILGRPLSAVHKTPDALSLQQPLALFERIAVALLPLAGSAEGLRMWLNAPNPDLADHPPIELLKWGRGEIVAELLEDALVGQPG